MVKLIHGTFWFVCPRCGKKLFVLVPDAACHGIFFKCRQCGWIGEAIIE